MSSEARTLIFDCDGVLADTERHGHLPCFNQVFEEFSLPVRWSEEDYGEKLAIGGGKERLASLLSADFVKAAGLPQDGEAQLAEVARWHRRKTELYLQRVASGALPPRRGVRRLIEEALAAGWQLAVASTSALESVRAVLQVAAGVEGAKRFAGVFAGDMVARKKPAPDIYQLAVTQLEAAPERTLVIEDSRNGLQAASAAGLACLVTVNEYTSRENFDEAVLVVDHLGDRQNPLRILQNPSALAPPTQIEVAQLEACLRAARTGTGTSLRTVERVVRCLANTAIQNESYLSELDSVVGDGDFGFSLARGFEKVLEDLDGIDRRSIGTFIKKVALIVTSRCGGTSGPIWGTAFLRAASAVGERQHLSGKDVVALLRAAFAGIQKRGGASLGDKTLLDALGPFTDTLEESLARGQHRLVDSLVPAAEAARVAAEKTRELVAKRGRAAYTGERSRGAIDPGAVAVALMARDLRRSFAPPS